MVLSLNEDKRPKGKTFVPSISSNDSYSNFHFVLNLSIFFWAGVFDEEATEVAIGSGVDADWVAWATGKPPCALDEEEEEEAEAGVGAAGPTLLRLDV